MELKDPLSVYIAGSNLEAQMICNHLNALGIPAHVIEDASSDGTYSFGFVSLMHTPRVYVERTQADEARKVIGEYEAAAIESRAKESELSESNDYCPACGEHVAHGTPTCPECERPIDWPDDKTEEDDENAPNMMSTMKTWKKPLVFILFAGPFLLAFFLPGLIEFVKMLFSFLSPN
jgi:hypothetical protein